MTSVIGCARSDTDAGLTSTLDTCKTAMQNSVAGSVFRISLSSKKFPTFYSNDRPAGTS